MPEFQLEVNGTGASTRDHERQRGMAYVKYELVRSYAGMVCEAAVNPTAALVPAAIGNAVFDAIGVRLRSVPFTPVKVKAAIARGSA